MRSTLHLLCQHKISAEHEAGISDIVLYRGHYKQVVLVYLVDVRQLRLDFELSVLVGQTLSFKQTLQIWQKLT